MLKFPFYIIVMETVFDEMMFLDSDTVFLEIKGTTLSEDFNFEIDEKALREQFKLLILTR